VAVDCAIYECGVIALGRCGVCGRAFCSSHQALGLNVAPLLSSTYGLNKCVECQEKEQAHTTVRQQREREQRGVDASKALRRALDGWEETCVRSQARIAAIGDPSERLVMACRHWLINPGGYSPLARFNEVHMGGRPTSVASNVTADNSDLFATAFPQYWPDAASVNLDALEPPWNSGLLARWFAARARAARVPSDKIDWALPGRIFTSSRRSARGWAVGTTQWLSGRDGGGQFERVVLLADGRLGDPKAHISSVAMVRLADLLNLGNPQLVVGPKPVYSERTPS
jgi:hypothetical protein